MFIYVYSEELKDKLISLGYKLIKTSNQFYIFENKADSEKDIGKEKAVVSNTFF